MDKATIKQVKEEMRALSLQAKMQRRKELLVYTKYFPKIILTDTDIFFTKSGSGVKRFTPFWYNEGLEE